MLGGVDPKLLAVWLLVLAVHLPHTGGVSSFAESDVAMLADPSEDAESAEIAPGAVTDPAATAAAVSTDSPLKQLRNQMHHAVVKAIAKRDAKE